MTIGEKIAARRKELKLTLEDVGNAVGVGKSTVKKWETGYIANMRRDKISLLAKVLQMNPSEFIEDDSDDLYETSNISYAINRDNIYSIPVFESVSAGLGAYASDEIVDYIPVVLNNPYDADETMAIRVSGDSMYPKIEDGDIIIVRKTESVESGSIAVLLLDNEEGLVKKIKYGDGWVELHSINPEYKTKVFKGTDIQRLQIVGLVIGSYKTF